MDRTELLDALSEVATILASRGVSARVYIVGGAAMSLAYDATRVTRDIDGVILDGHGALMDAVQSVARSRGLPGSWLNEQASAYIPSDADPRGRVVFDHPSLRVIAASPERLLAMKVRAARRTDITDIENLASLTGCESAAAVFDVVTRVFPDEPIPDRGRLVVSELFGD